MKLRNTRLILSILLFLPSASVAAKAAVDNDPNVLDDTDRDIIDSYIKSRTELGEKNKPPETTPKTKDTTTATASPPSPPIEEKIQYTQNGEECKCVKYYRCNVAESANNTNSNDTLQGTKSSPGGSVILGVVDIRGGELQNDQTPAPVKNSQNGHAECPHYFDVCCAIKNVKEPNNTQSATEEAHPPPPEDPTAYKHTTCGKRNENGVGFKMTGGREGEAQFGEFPWTVALIQLETNEDNLTINKYVGGGSLLHPQVILTVAHNVLGKNRSTLRVRLGEWDTQTNDEPYPNQDRAISKVIIHEEFHRKTLFNDIALLILDEEARLAPNVETICLPPLNRKLNFDGQVCYSAGWGKDEFGAQGRYSDIMKKVAVPVVSKETCQKELEKSDRLPGFRLAKSFMCAGGSGSGDDTCKGDGGSALVCSLPGKDNNHYVQVGAVSWGLGCKSMYPGVYADIQYLTPWILKKMDAEGFSTQYCNLQD